MSCTNDLFRGNILDEINEVRRRLSDNHFSEFLFKYDFFSWCIYSRPLMAGTLMARLPRLFRTRSSVPWKKAPGCRFRIIKGDFLFSKLKMIILRVFIRIGSMRRF